MLRVTLKGFFGHKLRFAITLLAITLGVSFVVGSFVLTDSVRAQFATLFTEINSGIDLQVRGRERFDAGQFGGNTGAPVPEGLVSEIRALDGVEDAAGTINGFAVIVGDDGEPVNQQGPPVGINWPDVDEVNTLMLVEGRPPDADDEVAIDVDALERAGYAIGDQVPIVTPLGPADYTLVGSVSFGESNALAGATLSVFTTSETQRLFNFPDQFQTIDIALAEGSDRARVTATIRDLLPADAEVVDQEVVIQEGEDSVGAFIDIFLNVLLGFAGIMVFVSTFLIYNTFRIVVGQRVRELALLRAIGASGGQVFRSVVGEALVVGVVASVVGGGLGVLLAQGLNAFISSAGFGTEDTQLVIQFAPFAYGAAVGIGVTLASAILPARQATRIPPVAAMREGFRLDGGSMRTRFVVGSTVTVLGVLMVANALVAGEGIQILVGMALGSILIFLGVAGLSPLVAGPVARVLGAPFRAVGVTGRLAIENAARNPRRTSSTAAALMIGLALVTMALVVGTSIKTSFAGTLSSAIEADWYIGSDSFFGFSPEVAAALAERPELAAVNAGRFGAMQVAGKTKLFNSVDYTTIEEMYRLDITDGAIPADARGLLVGTDPAADLGLSAGDEVEVLFNETGPVVLPVLAVFDETSVLGNWVIDLGTYEDNFTERLDYFLAATTAEGVAPDDARAAIEEIIAPYPQLEARDREEYQESLESQLDTVLVVVNVFLGFAIVIAAIGIINTLLLSVFERTRELGLLRAIGETRGQVWAMITVEAIVVAVFGAVLGVVIGLGFGVATATALPDDFVSVIDVPWTSLLIVLVLSALLGVVAAVFPALRATRINVLRAIAFE